MMKNYKLNLHLRRQGALLCVAAFLAAFLLSSLIVSVSVSDDLSQLNALLCSKYEYSATAQSSTLENTYYQYNAGISFTPTEDSQTRFDVDVLMQTESNGYSDAIFWNSEDLGRHCVAVSKCVADRHGLNVGDVIYSKHIVDGSTYGYTIEKILPAITTVRVTPGGNHSNGVIVMGYDEQYASNISHISILYANDSIEIVAEKCSEMPTNILYRSDEIITLVKQVAPYLGIYILLAAIGVVSVVAFLSKNIAHNFKRLVTSGADFSTINRAYYKMMAGTGFAIVALSGIISAAIFCIADTHIVVMIPVLCAMIIEAISLIVAAIAFNKHLWRT